LFQMAFERVACQRHAMLAAVLIHFFVTLQRAYARQGEQRHSCECLTRFVGPHEKREGGLDLC
jgi:hypothetical protein